MLTLWGRANSVNVQKVLWLFDELGLAYERIDAGMEHGRNLDPDYLAMNPNGRVPTLVDGEFILWESNSILRYLALEYGSDTTLYPSAAPLRASIDRWLDWTLSTLAPAERNVFVGLVRTRPEHRDMAAIEAGAQAVGKLWSLLDQHLSGRRWVEGEQFSIGDLVLGAYARRWFGIEGIERPVLPALAQWYQGVAAREGFQRYLAAPLT